MINRLKSEKIRHFLLNFYILVVCIFLEPIWYRNDDTVIAFLSKGINISTTKILTTYDTSVILNYVYSIFPNIYGFISYSIVQYGIILLSLNIILWNLSRNFTNRATPLFLVVLISFPTLISPTFTVTAGLASIASLLQIKKALELKSSKMLVLGLWLFIVATLVRDEVAAIVFVIFFLALVINKNKFELVNKQRATIVIAFLILFLTQIINRSVYVKNEFKYGREFMQYISYPIHDYGADKFIINQPEIMSKNDLTVNDIKIIRNYFVVDKNITDPVKIKKVLDEIGWNDSIFHVDSNRVKDQLFSFIYNNTYGLMSCLFLLVLLVTKNLKSKLMLIFTILILVILILRGRIEGFVTFLITLGALLFQNNLDDKSKNLNRFVIVALVPLTFFAFDSHQQKLEDSETAQKSFIKLTTKNFWNWGGSFPSQLIYPVFDRDNWRVNLQIKEMGWSTYITGTNSYLSLEKGGFLKELNSQSGVNFSAIGFHIPLLERYCFEHFGSKLDLNIIEELPFLNIYNAKCRSMEVNFVSENLEFQQENPFLWFTDKVSEINIRNTTKNNVVGKLIFSLEQSPCKESIRYSEINFQQKNYLINKEDQIYAIPVMLDAFEQDILYIEYLDTTFCQIQDDTRLFHSKISNFNFNENSS